MRRRIRGALRQARRRQRMGEEERAAYCVYRELREKRMRKGSRPPTPGGSGEE